MKVALHIQKEFGGASLAIVASTWELHHPAARSAARASMMPRSLDFVHLHNSWELTQLSNLSGFFVVAPSGR